jgi:hypothetical protein
LGIIADVKRYKALAGTSLALLMVGAAISGCGSDEKSSSTPATQETYAVVPAAAVTKGLGDTIALMTQLTATPATAADQLDQVEAGWQSYEGTVKTNDPNSYLAFEDALAAFDDAAKAKDGAKMATQVANFSTTSAAYLAKFPG